MKYLLDTNAVIAILNGNHAFIQQLEKHHVSDFLLSSIVLFELYFGAQNSQKVDENMRKIEGLLFDTLFFTREDAKIAGKIRADLKRKGTPIGEYDTLIAGQALNRGLMLITHNTREFARVEGLNFESWL